MKITSEQLNERLNWNLDQKIDHAIGALEQFYNYTNRNCTIMFSGGKDSTVLLFLARMIFPKIKATFINTTNEFNDILYFIKHSENIDMIMPKMTFTKTVDKYGFPLISKMVARKVHDLKYPSKNNEATVNLYRTGINKNGEFHAASKLPEKWMFLVNQKFDITHKCCSVLKHEPAIKYQKDTGLFPIIGTMAENSNTRRFNYLKYGCNILSEKTIISRPLSIWTDSDIWEAIKRFNIPYCDIYDKGEKNTGCAYCGFGCHLEKESRFERLKEREPNRYEHMMKLENNGITYKQAIDTVLNRK